MGRKQYFEMSESRGWMNMLRISNSPTIVSNVMVGVALAIVAHKEQWVDHLIPRPLHIAKPIVVITFVLLLLYFAGMVLNDAFDAKRDNMHRPNRPIPQGIIAARQAWWTGLIMTAIAILISFTLGVGAGIATVALSFYILLYTFLHHSPIAAIPLMAICRALVYIVAVVSFSSNPTEALLFFCVVIAAYTAILTTIGSFEHEERVRFPFLVFINILLALVPVIFYGMQSPIAWIAFVVFTIWMILASWDFRLSNNTPTSGMHKLLAGFALLDCVLIASIGQYNIMIISVLCFILTVAAHRKILGT